MESQEKELLVEFKTLSQDIQKKFDALEAGSMSKSDFECYKVQNEERSNKILDEIAKFKTPPPPSMEEEKKARETAELKAIRKFVQFGENSLTPDEKKTLTIGDPASGGYLAPGSYIADIMKGTTEISMLRGLARTVTIGGAYVEQPKRTAQFAAAWVAEIGTRSETTGLAYGLEKVHVHEMYGLVKISKHNLEDSAFNMDQQITDELSEQFALAEGTAFISGNGIGKPEGILTNASVTGFTGVTTSGKIVADDLISTLYALKAPYAARATWLWNRASTLAIRILKNGTTGDYLWRPGFVESEPIRVLNCPFLECPDMPTEAGSAKAVVVGDFKAGYLIVDRLAIELLRDPYSSKSTGIIEISGRKRVGGQVVLPEAIKVYTLKA